MKMIYLIVFCFVSSIAVADTHYVSLTGNNTSPYNTWTKASRNIRDAVLVASSGDTVLVNDGVYDKNTAIMNGCIVSCNDDSILIKSLNGPSKTTIKGDRATLGSGHIDVITVEGANVEGFTISNSRNQGVFGGIVNNCIISNCVGGAAASMVNNSVICNNSISEGTAGLDSCIASNCVIRGNRSYNPWDQCSISGGAVDSTLYNCLIASNTSYYVGSVWHGRMVSASGMLRSTAYNCTITGNTTPDNQEEYSTLYCTMYNCIISYNNITNNTPHDSAEGFLYYSCIQGYINDYQGYVYKCTTVLPSFQNGFHLAGNSPCIDSGTNVINLINDIDGTPRPLDGKKTGIAKIDMGCYEYGNPLVNSDNDGVSDYDEIIAGTNPLDVNDFLNIESIIRFSTNQVTIRWDSKVGKVYDIICSTNLKSVMTGCTNVAATSTSTAVTINMTNTMAYYRIAVK